MTETSGRRLFVEAVSWMASHYPAVAGGLLTTDPGDEDLVRVAEEVLERYAAKTGASPSAFHHGLEAVATLSFDFLRMQSRFMKTGNYRSSQAAQILEGVYLNAQKMEGAYLDGLLLTYAFWPNQARILQLYLETFLPGLQAECRLLEIGVGHGLMAVLALDRLPDCRYMGLDVSPYAIRYTREFLASAGLLTDRVVLVCQDVGAGLPPAPPPTQPAATSPQAAPGWDALLCCEVLEHVEQPDHLLSAVRQALRLGGSAFVSTVANIEAEDHIFRFENVDHIHRVIAAAGFHVRFERVMPLKGFESAGERVPLNYAAVVDRIE